ncbi:MAG: hypothetical protein K8T91_12950 [Planctomycetes bacterium]|nr:hypothetical protein [Planctomycetota bacterium]
MAGATHGPLGPCIETAGAVDNLPRQAGYSYRVWLPATTETATVEATWTGSSQAPTSLVLGSGTIRVGSVMWKYCGTITQPADSESLALTGGGSAYLLECVGRKYVGYSGGGVDHFAIGSYIDDAGDHGVTWEDTGGIITRKVGEAVGSFRTAIPVIPGQAYRINAVITCWGTTDILRYMTRAPGGNAATSETVGATGAISGVADPGANWIHLGDDGGCENDEGWFTAGYGLRTEHIDNWASGFVGPNVVTLAWQITRTGEPSEWEPGSMGLKTLYVLPVGFTLREATGGTVRDDVWQDAPAISSDTRLMLEALARLQNSFSGGSTTGGTTTGGTTSGGTTGLYTPEPGELTNPLDHNLPLTLGQQNYSQSIHLEDSTIGFSWTLPFELIPTSGGPISTLGGGLWEFLNTWRTTIRDLVKWMISLWRTWAFFSRIFGG